MTGPIRAAKLAIAVAAVALASPAVATAEPKEWDIGAYDQCKASYPYDRQDNIGRWYDHLKYCCIKTGGVWAGSKCVAPPKEQAEEWTPPSDLSTQTLTPDPVYVPPGSTIQNLEPVG
ncbi:hypothetical protein [Mycolicibacterium stellerae]|uniref:hypothetical protein n=1 Tax=Mycolicibacterium stellerae TaxID=2358193 RepID=UPI000F0B417E|nr:hypothetical protein [Mycolicibacterium stellerae]